MKTLNYSIIALASLLCWSINAFSQSQPDAPLFDFESGNIDGWVKQNPGAGIEVTTEDKYSGTYALKMVNAAETNAWSVQAFTPPFETIPGHSYKLTFWVKAVGGGGKGRISTVEANQLGEQYWADFSVGSNWQQKTFNNLPAFGTSAQLAFDLGYMANKTYYIDDIVLEDLTPDVEGVEPLALNRSKFLGNILANNIPANFDRYWNQITPENAGKWESVEWNRNQMNWTALDMAYNHAKSKKIPFKYHTLVWGSQEPSWVKTIPAAEQKAEIEELMSIVSQRYPNIDIIDVVNEPLHAPSSIRNALGGSGTTGWDWIIWSFQKAREYFPNAELHINEYGIIGDPTEARKYLEIIKLLQARGLIDGIGIQCHEFNMNYVSVYTMNEVLNLLGATGLPIYVSELDINGNPANEDNQLKGYAEKFPVLWEHPSVAGVTLWGYITGTTWKEGTGIVEQNGTERKAMKWLKGYMASEASNVPNKFATSISTPGLPDTKLTAFAGFDELHVLLSADIQAYSVALTTLSGQVIHRTDGIFSGTTTIPISGIGTGIYICSVETEQGRYSTKVIIN